MNLENVTGFYRVMKQGYWGIVSKEVGIHKGLKTILEDLREVTGKQRKDWTVGEGPSRCKRREQVP